MLAEEAAGGSGDESGIYFQYGKPKPELRPLVKDRARTIVMER